VDAVVHPDSLRTENLLYVLLELVKLTTRGMVRDHGPAHRTLVLELTGTPLKVSEKHLMGLFEQFGLLFGEGSIQDHPGPKMITGD
jgi:hypothetical protein